MRSLNGVGDASVAQLLLQIPIACTLQDEPSHPRESNRVVADIGSLCFNAVDLNPPDP